MTIRITTISGLQMEFTGAYTKIIGGEVYYYAAGQSFPAEIVEEL